jgi:hypothetical protein
MEIDIRGDIVTGAQPVRFARHAGMEQGYSVTPLPDAGVAEWCAGRTKREREILGLLLAVQNVRGALVMMTRGALKASDQTMHDLFYAGLVNGCGSADHRGTGNTPSSSWWWLTERGEQVARAGGLVPRFACAKP